MTTAHRDRWLRSRPTPPATVPSVLFRRDAFDGLDAALERFEGLLADFRAGTEKLRNDLEARR